MAELTEQQIEFFTAMEATFNTPGWELMTQGWEAERNGLAEHAFFGVKSMEDMRIVRLRYRLLTELIELPKTIGQQREEVEELEPQDNE